MQAWLEPYPGPFPEGNCKPVSLEFIASLQRLHPRERAVLVLSDVLDFRAVEVAEILDCGADTVDELLTRARGATRGALPGASGNEAALVSRFTAAFARGDLAAIGALLARDAWVRLPPLPLESRGRRAGMRLLAVAGFPGGTRAYRLVATRANGQPAFGCYLVDPATGTGHACGFVMLTVGGDAIAAIDRFLDNSLLPRFGLPRTLPGSGP